MRRRMVMLLVVLIAGACGAAQPGAASGTARIAVSAPSVLDPAASGDAESSAVIAQLFETLTALDDGLTIQPALAESWRVDEGGRRIVFQLRADMRFSDGTALRASDVVRSWLRVIDPDAPSPLHTLLLDVRGASAYVEGQGTAADVGLRADDPASEVIVDLVRPTSAFPSIVAGPTFAVVPPGIDDPAGLRPGDGFVASGGYRLASASDAEMVLEANPNYWAGPPALNTITVLTDLAGASPVERFERGDLDYAEISSFDASWIAYDETLGPQLRTVPSMSTDYYGFDTTVPPFDDVRVRQAFGAAVDWRRIARLAASDPTEVATSMVPPGIPDRTSRDMLPTYNPEAGRALLADAGFPGGAGFPDVTLVTGGAAYDEAIVAELERELGVTVHPENMDFGAYFDRLDTDAPAMWSLSWIADYPGRNDFLGVLLGSGSANNYGRWSSPDFDAAIAEAASAGDAAAVAAAYDRAEEIVRRDVPVIPMSYVTGWALSRDGFLGARQNGLGSLRFAGLAWAGQ
jgi:ABC-type oligopeptide transport system substrate-binding subunit